MTTGGPSGATSEGSVTMAQTSVVDAGGSGTTIGVTATASTDDPSTDSATDEGPSSCEENNGGCDPNATCSDDSGSVECTCNLGYDGSGLQCNVDATLPMLRIEMPCLGQGTCNSAYCVVTDSVTDQGMLTGNPAVSYEVTLRFRGVLEEKGYSGGVDDGLWNEGGNPIGDGWNTYSLDISDPTQTYWLNNGSPGSNHCEMVDYQRSVTVMGGSMVSVTAFDPNNCAARNYNDQGQPIVIPEIPPAPMAFVGQFLQVDVVDIVPVP